MQAYCVKCRAKKEMRDPRPITMKNGKPATHDIPSTWEDQAALNGIQLEKHEDREHRRLSKKFGSLRPLKREQ